MGFEAEMHKLGDFVGKRYGPEFMAWAHSPSVRAVNEHKMAMMHTSKELHNVMSDAFTLYNEVAHGGVKMGWGFNKDGSYEMDRQRLRQTPLRRTLPPCQG